MCKHLILFHSGFFAVPVLTLNNLYGKRPLTSTDRLVQKIQLFKKSLKFKFIFLCLFSGIGTLLSFLGLLICQSDSQEIRNFLGGDKRFLGSNQYISLDRKWSFRGECRHGFGMLIDDISISFGLNKVNDKFKSVKPK